ncbi:MAG TPA: FAD-dependent monooxygenase [Candidatus Sulfotelmatobacter sp.]|nr:FAD-dependent monooxygenase [Candidatus Sulfotelmatobacter sp.]
MIEQTDVFVIGGGPAGLAAAIAARKKGFRVVVADGARWPIEKACGEGLLPDAIAALRELAVSVGASDGQVMRGVRFVGRESEVAARFPAECAIGMRRVALHAKLVEHAQSCGVELLWNAPVTGISRDGVALAIGRRDEIESGAMSGNESAFVPARWVVGADGIGSRVRLWAGLDAAARRDCRYAVRRHYRMKPWSDFMEVHWGDRTQAYVTPVGTDEVCVVMISGDRGAKNVAWEAEFPTLARRLESAVITRNERGAITMTQKLRHVQRGNVALVGDASGSVDAITGEGLALGFRQAIALAEAFERDDLSRYQAAHRRLARRPALMGRLMLVLDGRPRLRERTIRALAADARVFARLLAVHIGAKSEAHLAATGAMLGWRLVAA